MIRVENSLNSPSLSAPVTANETNVSEPLALKVDAAFNDIRPDPSAFSNPSVNRTNGSENSPQRTQNQREESGIPAPATPSKISANSEQNSPQKTQDQKVELGSPAPITPQRVSSMAPGVFPSPEVPALPSESHYLDGFMRLGKQKLHRVSEKERHTMVLGSPDTERNFDEIARKAHAYVSTAKKALKKGLFQKVPPLKIDPDTQVEVLSPNRVQLTRGSKRRLLGVHGEPGKKSYFPMGGNDTVSFSKEGSDGLSMEQIHVVHHDFKRRKTGKGLKGCFMDTLQSVSSSSSSSQ